MLPTLGDQGPLAPFRSTACAVAGCWVGGGVREVKRCKTDPQCSCHDGEGQDEQGLYEPLLTFNSGRGKPQ